MYQIEADTRENVLYIDLTGRMEKEEIDEAAEEAVAAGEQLTEGYHIINDLSGFAPPSPEAAQPIKRAQAELEDLGVDRVIRIADEDTNQVVLNAFERRSQDVGYGGETAESVPEAEAMLEDETVAGHASR